MHLLDLMTVMAIEQIGRAAQPQDVGKFRDNIPAQVKADLLHEVREFMRTRGIVGYATYGCIEVRYLCGAMTQQRFHAGRRGASLASCVELWQRTETESDDTLPQQT